MQSIVQEKDRMCFHEINELPVTRSFFISVQSSILLIVNTIKLIRRYTINATQYNQCRD